MLHIARAMKELNFGALMELYAEGNRENAVERYPELPPGQALAQAEQDFYQYLREVFFTVPGAYYAIWIADGKYVSALRLEPYKDGLLVEAVETAPEQRKKGYAEMLLRTALPAQKIYSHVHKKNIPSLRLHEKCGFLRISEQAVYIDGSVNSRCCTFCRVYSER